MWRSLRIRAPGPELHLVALAAPPAAAGRGVVVCADHVPGRDLPVSRASAPSCIWLWHRSRGSFASRHAIGCCRGRSRCCSKGLRAIGLDRPTTYIPALKSVFALLSVGLVYASYSVGRNLFGEGTGRLAAVLAAIWYELLYVSTVATPEVLSAYAIVGHWRS
jgi:hypothetical protein